MFRRRRLQNLYAEIPIDQLILSSIIQLCQKFQIRFDIET